MDNKNIINYQEAKLSGIINTLGLSLLAAICAGYFLFHRRFAEMHLSLPFLDFPIFVGEIILFICLLLLGVQWLVRYKETNEKMCSASFKVCLLFCGYAIFILGKAFYGYSQWGALAFRDAALFYYPIYAIFGYVFYKQIFFEGLRTVFFVLVLSVLFITKFDFYSYFTLTGFFLAIILIKKYPNKYIKYALFIILFIATDYKSIVRTSRTMLVGNTAAIVFVVSALLSILKIKKGYKFISLGVLLFFLTMGLIKIAERTAIDSLSKVAPLIKLYRDYKDIITETAPTFKMKEVKKLVLYNPEVEVNKAEEVKPVNIEHEIKKLEKDVGEKLIAANAVLNKTHTMIQEIRLNPHQAKSLLGQAQLSLMYTSDMIEETQSRVNTLSSYVLRLQQPIESQAVKADVVKALVEINSAKQSQTITQANTVMEPVNPSREVSSLTSLQILQEKARALDSISRELHQISGKLAKEMPAEYGGRDISEQYHNILFRIFIWEDMIREFWRAKPILGFDLGKPLRSKSLEIVGFARGEWERDGWIAPHNSYLHIIYRAGIIGIAYIISIIILLFSMINKSLKLKSITGILLCGILINWLVAANFLLILELPYNAIPFWSLLGLTCAYLFKTKAY